MKQFSQNTKLKMQQLVRLGMHICVALGILVFFSFQALYEAGADGSKKLAGFSVFLLDHSYSTMFYTVTLAGIVWLLGKVKGIVFAPLHFVKKAFILIISACFSLFSLLGVYFETKTSVELGVLLRSMKSLASFAVAFVGGVLFFYVVIRAIGHLCGRKPEARTDEYNWLSRFFGAHLYRNCMLVTAVCWLPQYIIRFPGAIPYDVWQSIAMHLGYTEITTQHPLIWGLMVGGLTQLGESIGIGWLAPLVICLIQHVLCILMIAYVVSTLKKLGFHKWILAGVLVFFVVLPPMSLYASTMYNDCFYGLAIMLLTVELMYYLFDRQTYFATKRHWALTALAVFGTIYRYNGLYTMLAVIAFVALRELYLLLKRRAKITQTVVVVLLCMALPLACGQVVQNVLNDACGAKEIRSRAMLAMPIQQSVRCLIVHGDSIPKEDYDALHAVLTWSDEEYAQAYNPRNFDNVKESFKIDATGGEMAGFIRAWLHLVVKYPATCFMATANQTYYLFSPFVDNVRYYESISAHTDKALIRYDFDATPYVLNSPLLSFLCRALIGFERLIVTRLPVVGLMVNPAVYTVLLVAVCLFTLFRKDRRALMLAVALLVTLAITFLGPAVYEHPRYIYPIMYCMPMLLAAFMLPEKYEGIDVEAKI